MKRSAMRWRAVPIALGFIALAVLAARYGGYSDSVTKMRGLTLRQDLFTMRAIVDQFTLDKHRRPQSLTDLVAAGYLKHVPTDPMTGRNDTWILEWSDDPKMPGIIGIRSGSSSERNVESSGKTKPQQGFTLYPPSVYMQFFLACSSDAPCTRTDVFRVDPVPGGCCILTVTNGDGRGTDEAHSYEVFLNGDRVIPTDHARNAQAPVKILQSNTLKVIVSGPPHSKLFILIAYDPRKSK
jgi:general secretion pathway protein G